MADSSEPAARGRPTAAVGLGDERTLAAPDAAPAPSDAPAGDRLPDVPREAYSVWGEVAQGGIGRVLRARDRRLDRPVAIKELLVHSEAHERRFVREALLTARLQHPAIVPIYEAGRWPAGDPFYAMKLVSGRSLAELIAARPRLDERLALLPHVTAAAQAVAYAHSLRIIHRDLKPANVLVGEFGETVVIDWGLAKDLAAADEPPAPAAPRRGEGLTLQGAVMGTPAYMPPEQAAGAGVDERADVYALGAMLYHVLAAAPPYDEAPEAGLLAAIAAGPPRRIDALVPRLSDELAAIVHKAMARDPGGRYRTAEDMADDLVRLQAGQIVAAHNYSARHLLRRFWRRHRAALSIAAAAVVVVVAVAAAAFVETDRARLFAQRKQREAVEARYAAEAASAEATARADELTLLQAQDALGRDPNRALAWLTTLSPGFADPARVRRIAADAAARGLSRAFVGHTDYINRFGVSADGARVVTASDDGTARVWDVADGRSIALAGHADEVWCAQFTADGEEVVTTSKDSTLRRWHARTGALLATIAVPAGTRQTLVRPDGSIVGARTTSGVAWIVRPGAPLELLTPPDERPRLAYLAPGGGRLIVQPELAEAYVLDLERGARQALPGTRGAPGRWFLDRPGALAVHATDATTTVWDLASMTRRELAVASTARRPAFAPAGDRVALAVGADIVVHDVATGAAVRRLVGHEGPVEVLEFTPDGRRLVSGAVDRSVRTWDLDSGRSEVHAGFEGIVTELEVLRDGRTILAVSTTGEVRLFEPHRAGRILGEHAARTTGLALGSDGRVASIDERGRLRIVDLAGRTIASHTVPPAPRVALVSAPDGRRLAGVSRAWDVRSDGRYPERGAPPAALLLARFDAGAPRTVALSAAALDLAWAGDAVIVGLVDGAVVRVGPAGDVQTLHRAAAPATAVAVSDAATIAVGDGDGRVVLLPGGEIGRHAERVTGLAFAPGGARLVSGCADHTVRIWDLESGSHRAFAEGGHGVEQVAFSPDGRTVVLLSGGETQLRRIDVATGEQRPPLAGAFGKLLGFTQSADGRRILGHGDDGAVRVFDVADGGGRTLAGHSAAIAGAGFSADGRVIVTVGLEGTVRAWPDDLPETMPALRSWLADAVAGETR
jgi:WD40 repeat protein